MIAGCLNEATVLAFLDARLPPTDRAEVETHLASCGACADLTTWTAADLVNRNHESLGQGRPFLDQLAPGARVGQYQILGAVGRGGMGEVYAAYHPELDRRIALKVVYEAGADTEERRARLLREARAIARLTHPNVVTVYDAGVSGDLVFIAMEFVDGQTLDSWLGAAARSVRQILDVFIAAGRGLAAAHAAQIVHRDFKPQNVMIGEDGSVRVMDFGLARLVHEDLPPIAAGDAIADKAAHAGTAVAEGTPEAKPRVMAPVTKAGALLGTPAYMAPEQFRREKTTARSDQFSFCVALHEALYGRRPVGAHLHGAPGRPAVASAGAKSTQAVNVPSWLRAVVERGLAE
ncbi:MAG TPA: protein kinase, partial [Polyangia bacterium]|nr:protein kinase [Polyangia bacterium]